MTVLLKAGLGPGTDLSDKIVSMPNIMLEIKRYGEAVAIRSFYHSETG